MPAKLTFKTGAVKTVNVLFNKGHRTTDVIRLGETVSQLLSVSLRDGSNKLVGAEAITKVRGQVQVPAGGPAIGVALTTNGQEHGRLLLDACVRLTQLDASLRCVTRATLTLQVELACEPSC